MTCPLCDLDPCGCYSLLFQLFSETWTLGDVLPNRRIYVWSRQKEAYVWVMATPSDPELPAQFFGPVDPAIFSPVPVGEADVWVDP